LKSYTKLYYKHFGYDVCDFVSCEICGAQAVDVNHIKARGMGGTKKPDDINNLMAVCRSCHIEYADKKQHLDFLIEKHNEKLRNG